MPKSFNQKLKILYLMQAFMERTDREHPMSVPDFILYLEGYGISVERKTVYEDIETLRIFGMKIENRRERPSGYYLADREFSFPELKILMDAVQSSRFITERQSRELVRKLEHLTSISEAKRLQNQTSVLSGSKAVNREIYDSIQKICDAMADNRQICFNYYEWDFSRELKPKRDGARYRVSPWKMIWNNENYYLIGLDERNGIVKHYRVDKIMHVSIESQKRKGEDIFRNFDFPKYVSGTFGMFGGKEQTVKMEFENHFVGVVLDRFGQDVMLIPKDQERFTMQARISISPQFYGWLAGLGTGAVIVSPENIRRDYISFLKKTLKNYGENSI